MDRCALFVDASYALADGAMAVHGTRRRDSVSWNHAGLLTLLAGLAKDRTGLPVLRCYWYELADGDSRTAEQEDLAGMPGLKLRLVNSRPGRREGIEAQLRRDLTTLAKSGGISDAFVVSADDNLAEIVAEVQDLGLRVVVLHISSPDGSWTIPQPLRQECDDIVEISGVHLRPFVELIRGAEPPALSGPYRNGTTGQLRSDASDGAAEQQQIGHVLGASAPFDPALNGSAASGAQAASGPEGFQLAPPFGNGTIGDPVSFPLPQPTGPGQNGLPQNGVPDARPHSGSAQHRLPAHSAPAATGPQHVPGPQGTGEPQYGAPAAWSTPGGYPAQPAQPAQNGSAVGHGYAQGSGSHAMPPGAAASNGAAVPHAGPPPPPPHQPAAPHQPVPPHQPAPSHQPVPSHQSGPSHQQPVPSPQQAPAYQPAPAYQMPATGQFSQSFPAHAAPPRPLPSAGPAASLSGPHPAAAFPDQAAMNPAQGGSPYPHQQYAPQQAQAPALRRAPVQQVAIPLPEAVKAAHGEGYAFGESIGREAPGLWLEAVLARKPRMPSDLEARLLQGSSLPIDSLLHDEVRHSLRRGFWDALEGARR